MNIKSNVTGELVIDPGNSVELKNINFTSSLSGQPGAAFENSGHLTLWDVSVFRNPLLDPNNYLIYNTPGTMLTTKGIIQIELDYVIIKRGLEFGVKNINKWPIKKETD